jgi:hypothetical protein
MEAAPFVLFCAGGVRVLQLSQLRGDGLRIQLALKLRIVAMLVGSERLAQWQTEIARLLRDVELCTSFVSPVSQKRMRTPKIQDAE